MIRTSVVSLALVALLCACGGGASGGTTPEATFESVQKAVQDRNWGAFYDLLTPDAQKEMVEPLERCRAAPPDEKAEMCEEFGLDPDGLDDLEPREFFLAFMQVVMREESEDVDMFAKAEVLDTKIEGDKAVIKIKMDGDEEDVTLEMVDAKWLMADFK